MLEASELRQQLYGCGLGAALLFQLASTALPITPLGRIAARLLQLCALRLGWEAQRAYTGLCQKREQQARFSNEGSSTYDEQDFLASEMGNRNELRPLE